MLSGESRPLIKIIFLPNFFTFTQMSTVNEQHSAPIVLFYIFLITVKNKLISLPLYYVFYSHIFQILYLLARNCKKKTHVEHS